MSLVEQINSDIKTAMKAKDKDALNDIISQAQAFTTRLLPAGGNMEGQKFDEIIRGNSLGFTESIPAGIPTNAYYTFFTSSIDGTSYQPYLQLWLNSSNRVNSTIFYEQQGNVVYVTINDVIIKPINFSSNSSAGQKILKPSEFGQLMLCTPE